MDFYTSTDTLQLIVILTCIVLSAIFSASETAITSLGSLKAKHLVETRHKASKQLNLWLTHPDRVLTTILIFNTVVNILASAVTTDLAIRHLGNRALGIATGILTLTILVFCEILPKAFAKAHHDNFAVAMVRFIYVVYIITFPVVWTLSAFTKRVLKIFGTVQKESPPITEEELQYLVNVGEKAGVLGETKKEMIVGVFEFDETKVREIMTPRPDIRWLRVDSSFSDAAELALESGFSRIPVCDVAGIDHVIGILLVKDLLRITKRGDQSSINGMEDFNLREIMREPFFIPESKLLMDVFKDLKRTKNHIAVVIDEHGGTAGLVTLEDILEEIVGEIQDEYDTEEEEVVELEPGIYDVAGSMNIDEFLEFFELDEEQVSEGRGQDIDTLAGWITSLIGDLPEVGKTVRIGPLNVEVADVDRQRVNRVRVSRIHDRGEKIAE